MPPLTSPERQRLARDYGISSKPKEKWPECYRDLFRNIQRLGDKRLDDWENEFEHNGQYGLDISNWRQRTKSRVQQLAKKAERLSYNWSEAKETDWRVLEAMIFDHLGKDINW